MASTTFVDNSSIIYASWLNDINATTYNGTFISSTITPSNLVCNGSVSGTGFTGLVNNTLSAPGQIGNGTPNTGAFTTLSATTLSTSGLATLNSLSVTGSTTLVTPNLGTPSTLVGTNITGTANGLNAGIGVNQTWTNPSKTLNTVYQNTTGKPILVQVTTTGDRCQTRLIVGVTSSPTTVISLFLQDTGTNTIKNTVSGIIPPNYYYKVDPTGGSNTGSLLNWAELS